MRSPAWIFLLVLAASFGARAQAPATAPQAAPSPEVAPPPAPAAAAPSAPAQTLACGTDKDCPGELICDRNVCVRPPPPAYAPMPQPMPRPQYGCVQDAQCGGGLVCRQGSCVPVAASGYVAPVPEPESIKPAYGFFVFGDYFPSSSVPVPSDPSKHQMSVLAGTRVMGGLKLPVGLRPMAIFEGGYAAAGLEPGKGNDGIFVGGGLEVGWVIPDVPVAPFVRANYDARVELRVKNSFGTLSDHSLHAAVGAHISRFFEVHVLYGQDYAGGQALGVGVSIGAMGPRPGFGT